MSQIRLAKTKDLEKIIHQSKPFLQLMTEAEMIKFFTSIGFEIFEQKIIKNHQEAQASQDWNAFGLRQMEGWSQEAGDADFDWQTNDLKLAPKLAKPQV